MEIRELKQQLHKYEKLHCSSVQEEKLFELRVYRLPARKKRELESLLQEFAASLDDCDERQNPDAPIQQQQSYTAQVAKPTEYFPTPTDSAYASNTTSDATLQLPHSSRYNSCETSVPCINDKHENVRSYIKHVPQSMIWSRPSELSDSAKRKMIVKRLEQVFTGKSSTRRPPEFAQQQQEVSTSAALVENCAKEARGEKSAPEGTREARILPMNSESFEGMVGIHSQEIHQSDLSGSTESSKESTPDQRPTRPMDLDPYRMQVGAENMNYIRHLGLASPVRRCNVLDDGDGWVYFNLLISMAQLHTFSVTPDFIRKAITDLSSKFEVSHDGQQVRWRGGTETPLEESHNGQGYKDLDSARSLKNIGPSNESPTMENSDLSNQAVPIEGPVDLTNLEDADSLDRKPPISHGNGLVNDYCFAGDDKEMSSALPANGHPGFSNRSDNLRLSHVPQVSSDYKSNNGLMIFYKSATFCTDLGGNMQATPSRDLDYDRYVEQPFGQCRNPDSCTSLKGDYPEEPWSLSTAIIPTGDTNSQTTTDFELDFPDMQSLSLHTSSDEVEPVPFEASGLAGVQPEDNFMVDVAMQHARPQKPRARVSPYSTPRRVIRRVHQRIPSESVAAFPEHKVVPRTVKQSRIKTQVLSTKTTRLAPSSLPQPSYICLPLSSSDSGDSDDSETDRGQFCRGSPSKSSIGILDQCQAQDGNDEMLPTGYLSSCIAPSKTWPEPYDWESGQDSDEPIGMPASARGRDPWSCADPETDRGATGVGKMSFASPCDAQGARIASNASINGSASELDC